MLLGSNTRMSNAQGMPAGGAHLARLDLQQALCQIPAFGFCAVGARLRGALVRTTRLHSHTCTSHKPGRNAHKPGAHAVLVCA